MPRPPERATLGRRVRREHARRAEGHRPLGARFPMDDRYTDGRLVSRAAEPVAPRAAAVARGPSGLVAPNNPFRGLLNWHWRKSGTGAWPQQRFSRHLSPTARFFLSGGRGAWLGEAGRANHPPAAGSHRERRRAKSDGSTSAAAFALCGGEAAEASKDWGPGGKEMNLRPVLHLMAARPPRSKVKSGPGRPPPRSNGAALWACRDEATAAWTRLQRHLSPS
jgi:hypothetical protein